MPKKKTGAKMQARPKGRPKSGPDDPTRAVAVQIRGTREWKEWLTQYAEWKQLTIADAMNQAVIAAARADGFRPAPGR